MNVMFKRNEQQRTGDAECQETTHEAAGTAATDDETRQQDVSAVRRVSATQRVHTAQPRREAGRRWNHDRRLTIGRRRVIWSGSPAGTRAGRYRRSLVYRVRRGSVLVLRRRCRWVEVIRRITDAFGLIDARIRRRWIIHCSVRNANILFSSSISEIWSKIILVSYDLEHNPTGATDTHKTAQAPTFFFLARAKDELPPSSSPLSFSLLSSSPLLSPSSLPSFPFPLSHPFLFRLLSHPLLFPSLPYPFTSHPLSFL